MQRRQEFSFDKTGWSVLALIRFFLASVVLVGHLRNFQAGDYQFSGLYELGGKAAVLGFLIISGFSIGYSYNKSQDGYFSRRFLRIYPLYFFAVLLTIIVQYVLGSPYELPHITMAAAGWKTNVSNFLMLQGFAVIAITYNGPIWSLSLEVFLYVLVPILYKLKNWMLLIFIALSLYLYNFVDWNFLYGYVVLVYCWPWLIGFFISTKRQVWAVVPFLILGAVAVIFNKERTSESLSIITYSVSVIGLLTCILYKFSLPSKLISIFNYLGDLSYPIYLFHMPLYLLFYYIGIRNNYLFFLLLFISIIPINYLFDKWLKQIFWKPLVAFVIEKTSRNRVVDVYAADVKNSIK